MAKIKLLRLQTMSDGTTRLQSQLYINGSTADFILDDGVLKHWRHGKDGFNFYKTDIEFEIVETKQEMFMQIL